MADLKSLQDRLNKDHKFLATFLDDPVTTLRKEGVTLPSQAENEVKKLAAQAKKSVAPTGSSVGSATPSSIEVQITIPI